MQLLSGLTLLLAAAGTALAAPAAAPQTAMVGKPLCFTIYTSTVRLATMPNMGPTTTITKYRSTKYTTKTLNLDCSGCMLQVETKGPRFGHGPMRTRSKQTKTVTMPVTTATMYQCARSPFVDRI